MGRAALTTPARMRAGRSLVLWPLLLCAGCTQPPATTGQQAPPAAAAPQQSSDSTRKEHTFRGKVEAVDAVILEFA